MDLFEALRSLDPGIALPSPLAIVGAGGKSEALFGLAAGARSRGHSVLVTTTTALRDPRSEEGRAFDRFVLEPRLAGPAEGAPSASLVRCAPASVTVLATAFREGGKIEGPPPIRFEELRGAADLILVEADGSRGHSIKAPASHEPVLPEGLGLVIGCIGLDCLGRPAEAATVHRLDDFLAVTDLAPGEPIGTAALEALVLARDGLFKAVGPGVKRVLLLTKSDLLDEASRRSLLEWIHGSILPGACDLVLLSSWGAIEIVAS